MKLNEDKLNNVTVDLNQLKAERLNESFLAISGEKRYMDALKQYGLDDPRTFRTQSELKNAINSFERTTGLRWPFE